MVTVLHYSIPAGTTTDGYMMSIAADVNATLSIYSVDINPARTVTYGKLVQVQATRSCYTKPATSLYIWFSH